MSPVLPDAQDPTEPAVSSVGTWNEFSTWKSCCYSSISTKMFDLLSMAVSCFCFFWFHVCCLFCMKRVILFHFISSGVIIGWMQVAVSLCLSLSSFTLTSHICQPKSVILYSSWHRKDIWSMQVVILLMISLSLSLPPFLSPLSFSLTNPSLNVIWFQIVFFFL